MPLVGLLLAVTNSKLLLVLSLPFPNSSRSLHPLVSLAWSAVSCGFKQKTFWSTAMGKPLGTMDGEVEGTLLNGVRACRQCR